MNFPSNHNTMTSEKSFNNKKSNFWVKKEDGAIDESTDEKI